MKVLLIGGTGTISGDVTLYFLKKGVDLYLLNRGRDKKYCHLAKYIICDVNDKNNILSVLQDSYFDVIIDFLAFTPNQLKGHLDIFSTRCKQFIFISSCGVFKGSKGKLLNENSPKNINSDWKYVLDKIECENLIRNYYENNENYFTIVRPHHTYNNYAFPAFIPNDTYSLLTRIYNCKPTIMWKSGIHSKVVLTHAEDFAVGLFGLLLNPDAFKDDFNITSECAITWDNALKVIYNACNQKPLIAYFDEVLIEKKLFNVFGTITSDKNEDKVFDLSKLKKVVPNYNSKIDFQTGTKRILKKLGQFNPVVNGQIDAPIDLLVQRNDFDGKKNLKKASLTCTKGLKGLEFLYKIKYIKNFVGLYYEK